MGERTGARKRVETCDIFGEYPECLLDLYPIGWFNLYLETPQINVYFIIINIAAKRFNNGLMGKEIYFQKTTNQSNKNFIGANVSGNYSACQRTGNNEQFR